jgi:periplasmic protein TonB
MFEQTLVAPKGRPWTMAASITFQCATSAAIILTSLLRIDSLGPIHIPDPMPPFPRAAAVKVVAVQRPSAAVTSVLTPPRVFISPTRIQPAAVALAPVTEAPVVSLPGGVSGATDGVVDSIPNFTTSLPRGAVPATVTRDVPPAAAPAPTETPRRIGGDVLEAKILNRVIPEYPAIARQMRLSGIVQLAGVIGRDGEVKSLQVISGHPVLVSAAIAAVKQWKYRPTLLNGRPVEVVAPITVNFTLR